MIAAGAVLAILGLVLSRKQFAYSWLTAYMFVLSFVLGALFLVLVHHLFDASWSVPIRRICEHIACLSFPWMALFFIPIAIFAKPEIYGWMSDNPANHPLVEAKLPLFTMAGYYLSAAFCFFVWWFISSRLRHWSLEQDRTGAAGCTEKMRGLSYIGIFLFAATLTLAAIMWMKALQYQWFSTMYGVYYFAGSVWMTIGTVYLITALLKRQGPLKAVTIPDTFYFLGSLLFAFTVFYAYIHFSQYFIIWNANMPEETFWYLWRERGTWFDVGMIIIFGHFFVPFLTLLRIDVKLSLTIMTPVVCWAWLMHFIDMCFNVLPVSNPDNFPFGWIWLPVGCAALMLGVLIKIFVKNLNAHPLYPIRDPRLAESLGVYVPPAVAGASTSHGGVR
jgi:hypothetical protein